MCSVEFCLRDAFVFDAAHQVLQSVDHMGADVPADEHAHDVVAHSKLALVQPDADVMDARKGIGGGNDLYDLKNTRYLQRLLLAFRQ